MALPDVLKQNLRLPLVASPMFIVSTRELVVEQCKAGIVGSFPSLNARTVDEFEQWLQYIVAELAAYDAENPDAPSAPYAVNMMVHKTNPRVEEDLALCVKYKVPIVITSLGAREDVNEAVHSYGGITLHDVINNRFARKAIQKGADGIIAVATGAGGHAGTISPFALVQEIREWFDGPLLLSGCMSTGPAILGALAMGADLAYMGSAFIATEEANAVDDYKQMVIDSGADDILYTSAFSGVHGNYLRPSIVASGLDPEALGNGDASQLAKLSDQGKEVKAWKNIWGAGQGIGPVKNIVKAGDLVATLAAEFEQARQSLQSKTG
ncbi:nitronate monooxygenase [Halioglobus maricola]|uniref:Nitronate monooxygenase n=1 Tax=Halioglobus maricola TaxID=2601894 RepID=A0A5P9NHR8_9GAMM|nr:nitronate monooxygenase family protein [Halioglobus maricola]QFU75373.1 nitronate monooxygenase [Halioglobus maricola]